MTRPRISPIAQPVRQCAVAEKASLFSEGCRAACACACITSPNPGGLLPATIYPTPVFRLGPVTPSAGRAFRGDRHDAPGASAPPCPLRRRPSGALFASRSAGARRDPHAVLHTGLDQLD